MAIYPTKTSKSSSRKSKLRAGIWLVSIFSVLLLLVIFNFFHIFTISVLGIFGLLFYPVCVCLIVLGILLILDKSVKASRPMIILSTIWLVLFVLILQLATSPTIGSGFSNYMIDTFKNHITAGGVIFGVILYPLYFLTYTVASYIILCVALVVVTALLIDRVRVDIISGKYRLPAKKDKDAKKSYETSVIEETAEDNVENEIDDLGLDSFETTVESKNKIVDDDIFIADDEESEQRVEAKARLGLSKDRTIKDLENIAITSDDDEEEQSDIASESRPEPTRPKFIVHDDSFDSTPRVLNDTSVKDRAKAEKEAKDAERKQAALNYLNISKGKFETKAMPKGIDNVSAREKIFGTSTTTETNTTSDLKAQTDSNISRLQNLTQNLYSSGSGMQAGVNPFRDNQNVSSPVNSQPTTEQKPVDLYDESLTKRSYSAGLQSGAYSPSSSTVSQTQGATPFVPKKAQEVYSGDVKENIVEASSFRPVQPYINTPKVSSPAPVKKVSKPYVRPTLDLLNDYSSKIDVDDAKIMEKGEKIVETLRNFKIETILIDAVKGPTFTRYEFQMAPGISVNSVSSKFNDICMVLESAQCRLQAPVPGKNAFGVEVPNTDRTTVGLREVLASSAFQNSKSPLTFALGKDISNTCQVNSIDNLVHTLVAGTTGSGKSVCLNTMLLSLLYKASPDEMKILLVDPKSVEFNMFANLPHMLIRNPITECDKAVDALNWLVEEMERRYKRLGTIFARSIEEYNKSDEVLSGALPKMFYIVMIFDEVGDFMIVAKKEIEEKIQRLAAKSRACGIHLVLATQRPTVDVITGTIKANLPTRIAFAVKTYQDSKTILDGPGAESLLGMGDMLFVPKNSIDMQRIQGCFVSGKEVKRVIDFIKENNEADFDEEIEDQMFNHKDGFDPSGNGAEDAFDPLLKDCLRYFIKSKKASASSLQGYFGIGYPKANKIVLQMERAGFVSPGDSNGRRTLYITQQEFEERFGESLDE